MHLSHRCAAVALQLTTKMIYEKHYLCAVDPTTTNVDKYLIVKKKEVKYCQEFTEVKHSSYIMSPAFKVFLVQKMIVRSWCNSICQHEQTVLPQNISDDLLFIDKGC
jgi:hypothetical protein